MGVTMQQGGARLQAVYVVTGELPAGIEDALGRAKLCAIKKLVVCLEHDDQVS